MIKKNIEYIGFDDRPLILIGAPVISLLFHFLFFNKSLSEFFVHFPQEWLEGMAYTIPFWLFYRYLIIRMRKKYSGNEAQMKRICMLSIMILVATPIIQLVISGALELVYLLPWVSKVMDESFLRSMFATYVICSSIIFFYESVYFFGKYKAALVEKEQIKQLAIQSQLDNLRNQINPHFLFNSLNTLMNLISTDSERAMNFLSKLSKFYRYTVSKKDEQLVSLDVELENLAIYAELLHERFQNGIIISLPSNTPGSAYILPLCLQLLVENAVKHNVVSEKQPLHIEVKISQEGKYITVINNIQEKIQEVTSTGMGLKNIKERVALTTNKELTIETDKTHFHVSLPLVYVFEKTTAQ